LDSFYNISKWLEEIRRYAPEGIKIVLIGNKSDLVSDRKVSNTEALNFARELNLQYYECSAWNGMGLNNAFMSLLHIMMNTSSTTIFNGAIGN